MKISEVLTLKAKIMEAPAKPENAIIDNWIKNNPSIRTDSNSRGSAKRAKKAELGKMDDNQKAQTLAQMKKEGDQWIEDKKGKPDHRSKAGKAIRQARKAEQDLEKEKEAKDKRATEPKEPSVEFSPKELKNALGDAKSDLASVTNSVDDHRKRNHTSGPTWNDLVLDQLMADTRINAINKVLDKKKAYTKTNNQTRLHDVLLAQRMTTDSPRHQNARDVLNQIYKGLPNQDAIVDNIMDTIWPKVRNSKEAVKLQRAYNQGDPEDAQEIDTDKVVTQGQMRLNMADTRGIKYDNNQKRDIISGRIGSEVRIVADYRDGNGLLETPLGVLEGKISPFTLKGLEVGDYAQCVLVIKEVPTNESFIGRGFYENVRSVGTLKRGTTIAVSYGNKQIQDFGDSYNPSTVKPLQLKGNISANRELPRAAKQYNEVYGK